MSKFLKFIVNLIVICVVLVAGMLIVPPLLGVDTFMIDDVSIDSNLPMGSVTYAKRVKRENLSAGDKIMIQDGKQIYEYQIADMDATAGSYTLKNPRNSKSEDQTVALTATVAKPVLTVPFIAYAVMALQSKEGLIIIGLGVIFLIILFVLAELWKKDTDEDDEEEDYEDEEYEEDEEEDEDEPKSRRQLKKEAKRAEKEAKKEARRRRKEGLDDEDEEEELPPPVRRKPAAQPLTEKPAAASADAVLEETLASIAAGVAGVKESEVPVQEEIVFPQREEAAVDNSKTMVMPQAEELKEAVAEKEAAPERPKTTNMPEPEQRKEKIRHTPSAQELLNKASRSGEEPKVEEDKDAGVTLLDYTDLL